ncbi:MAG: SDR family oxidoreductase [Solirubrobacteraceae bacterium]
MSETAGRVAGKVIVVTGAAGGQGAADCRLLVAHGAQVIATDLPQALDAGVRAQGSLADLADSSSIHPRPLDVSDPGSWANLATWVGQELGQVHGLVNNAGVTSRVRLPDVDVEEWNRVMAVNLTGPMLGITTLLPVMPTGASIVNVGSLAALTGHYTVAYTASKWGLRGLTHSAAMELGPRGIRVNAIHPGYIHTPMTASAPESFLAANEAVTPLQRGGQAEEVAELVLFLMSDESSFITGVDLPIDGGQSRSGAAKFLSDALARKTG